MVNQILFPWPSLKQQPNCRGGFLEVGNGATNNLEVIPGIYSRSRPRPVKYGFYTWPRATHFIVNSLIRSLVRL